MNVTKINSTIYQIETSSKSGPILQWIIQIAINKPELLLKILTVLAALAKWAFRNFINKEGKPKTPFWVKALSWIGNKEIKDLRVVCDDACKTIEELPEIKTF